MQTKKISLNELKLLIKQIISEETKTNEIFNLFNKQKNEPNQNISNKKMDIKPGEITIEGIDATGKGYSVWSGNNPIGDLRSRISRFPKNDFGSINIKGNDFDFYFVTVNKIDKLPYIKNLKDHVGRPAYFTVSALKGSVDKEKLKNIADDILLKNKESIGIIKK